MIVRKHLRKRDFEKDVRSVKFSMNQISIIAKRKTREETIAIPNCFCSKNLGEYLLKDIYKIRKFSTVRLCYQNFICQ